MNNLRIATTAEKLLFSILQELKSINEKLNKEEPDNSSKNIPSVLCPKCGKDHKLPGIAGVCARKYGKGGAKK